MLPKHSFPKSKDFLISHRFLCLFLHSEIRKAKISSIFSYFFAFLSLQTQKKQRFRIYYPISLLFSEFHQNHHGFRISDEIIYHIEDLQILHRGGNVFALSMAISSASPANLLLLYYSSFTVSSCILRNEGRSFWPAILPPDLHAYAPVPE